MKIPALLCAFLSILAAPLWAQQPARGAGASRVVSPEIAPDRRVTFRLLAPKADEVFLTGEFLPPSGDFGNPSRAKLTKDANGVWSITVGPVEPETYHYHFTVDGVRVLDPGNPNLKIGSTPSTVMNYLEVRGAEPFFYDGRPVPHGEVRLHWYHSRSLGTLRRVAVYTPPNYDSDRRLRFPVLYLLHGANADETAWTRYGRANLIMDNLIAEGRARPFIVVMPFGYGVDPMDPATRGQNTAQFSKDLREDLVPFIDEMYRTLSDHDHRALVGLSMGGGQALGIGLNNLSLFGYVGGFSGAVGAAENLPTTYAGLIKDPAESNQRLKLLWIGCGRDDRLFGASRDFSRFLMQHGIRHTFRETEGDHTWMVWRRYLHELAPQLFVPDPAPQATSQ